MRLIILNQFFYPDHSATSQLMTVLAEDLTCAGVEVTAMASRGSYNGGTSYETDDNYRGVAIRRIWATNFGKHTIWRRLTDYFSFYLGAIWALLTVPRHDVIMALTTPPLIGLVGLLIARLRGMRFVSLQEDLYPDVGIALGFIPARGVIPTVLEKLSRLIIRRADRVIVLSDCMYDYLLAKFSPVVSAQISQRVDVIHNWADGTEVKPLNGVKGQFFAARDLASLTNKFIVLFTGNLGLVNDFAALLQAAKDLQDEPDLAFVFIGAGARKQEIQAVIETEGLKNLHLLPYQTREQMPLALGAADALLITLRNGLAGMSVPSKTYTSLAAGRPLLFVGDRRASVVQIIEHGNCGFACGTDESDRLVQTLREWVKAPSQACEAGARARLLFEQKYTRQHAVAAYHASLRRCLAVSGQSKVRAVPPQPLIPSLPLVATKPSADSISTLINDPMTSEPSSAESLQKTVPRTATDM